MEANIPPTIILWIQNTPKAQQTVLSCNGKSLQSGTSIYIKAFQELTSKDLKLYTTLTPTIKRLVSKKKNKRFTYLSGHFIEKDNSNRQICYRALIYYALSQEEECALLEKEVHLHGCSISEEDYEALKKKNIKLRIIILITLIILILLIICL